MEFHRFIGNLLTSIKDAPVCLEQKYPEISRQLTAVCGNGQGLGNKASDHECSFAYELERHGCKMTSYPISPALDGFYYVYQPNGTQKSIDFRVMSVVSGNVVNSVDFDLKHSVGKTIYLNDGTFLDDVIYIISFTRTLPREKGKRKCDRKNVCGISLGQHILTEKDRAALKKRFDIIREINSVEYDLDFLRLYIRNANQYDCDSQFKDAFIDERFAMLLAWISQFEKQTEEEQRCQSA
jgi:hypothetical protein